MSVAVPQGLGKVSNVGRGRKQASVVEMLEYVKGLDIDPIKEADMLWIAEEAFNAALPPGWSEHQDEDGRVYFHNGATGESVWRHPMDDLFREVVEYQRRVMRDGGFHHIEDEIAELEENIRRDLADWMELFDEHGEKFFYNRKTDDSRFDDPRMSVYHNLYARIKMVAKMKERLPILARAPRPEEPTPQELELRRRQHEEEERYLKSLIKIQSVARVVIAKRAYRNRLMQATVQKGPQPLRGKLRLRMEKMGEGGRKELVLSLTTPHRRARAAAKIQARMRGFLARKRFRPLVLHRAFLSKVVTKIQCMARVWLARRRAVRLRQKRVFDAATNLQRCYRGHRDRQYVSSLRAQKARFAFTMKCLGFIQDKVRERQRWNKYKKYLKAERARLIAEWQEQERRKEAAATKIQSTARGMKARKRVRELRAVANGVLKAVFDRLWKEVPRRNAAAARIQGGFKMLMAMKLLRALQLEKQIQHEAELAIIKAEQDKAATKIQARWRGYVARRKQEPWTMKGWFEYTTVGINGVRLEVKFLPNPTADDFRSFVHQGRPATDARHASIEELQAQLAQSIMQINMGPPPLPPGAEPLPPAEEVEAPKVDEVAPEPEPPTPAPTPAPEPKAKAKAKPKAKGKAKAAAKAAAPAPASLDASRQGSREPGDDAEQPPPSPVASPKAEAAVTAKGSAPAPPPAKTAQAAAQLPASTASDVAGASSATSASEALPLSGRAATEAPDSPLSPGGPRAAGGLTQPVGKTLSDAAPPKAASPRPPPAKAGAPVAKAAAAPPQQLAAEDGSRSQGPSPSALPSQAASPAAQQGPGAEEHLAPEAASQPDSPQPGLERHGSKTSVGSRASASAATSPAKASSQAAGHRSPAQSSRLAPGAMASPHSVDHPEAATMEDGQGSGGQEVAALADGEQAQQADAGTSEAPLGQRRRSPAKPNKDKLVAAVEGKLAHTFLVNASKMYVDKVPPRHPDDMPRPPARTADPMPPAHSDPTTGKFDGLRMSQSETALHGKDKKAMRKSYGGTVVGGKFIKAGAQDVDDLSEADRQAILADIERRRQEQQAILAEKAKLHKARKEKEELSKAEKFKAQLSEVEALEEERRRKKVKELKKWLKAKEEESRAKKEREAEMMQMVMDKEMQQKDMLKKVEQERLEQRERRLRIAERQKAKLEMQLAMARGDTMPNMFPRSPSVPSIAPSTTGYADPYAQTQMGQMGMPRGMPGQEPFEAPLKAGQRVVHRHVHHHVHYHDGSEDPEGAMSSGNEGPLNPYTQFASPEERRQLEMASEARVRAELERQPPDDYVQLPGIENGPDTPTMIRRAASMGQLLPQNMEEGMRWTRTQEAFRKLPLLPAYQRGLERAVGSYADSGRPRRLQGAH